MPQERFAPILIHTHTHTHSNAHTHIFHIFAAAAAAQTGPDPDWPVSGPQSVIRNSVWRVTDGEGAVSASEPQRSPDPRSPLPPLPPRWLRRRVVQKGSA